MPARPARLRMWFEFGVSGRPGHWFSACTAACCYAASVRCRTRRRRLFAALIDTHHIAAQAATRCLPARANTTQNRSADLQSTRGPRTTSKQPGANNARQISGKYAANVRRFTAGHPPQPPAASAAWLARQGFGQMNIIADFPHCHCRTMCHNRSALRMTAGGCIHQPARAHRRFARPGKAGDVIRNTRLTKHMPP